MLLLLGNMINYKKKKKKIIIITCYEIDIYLC